MSMIAKSIASAMKERGITQADIARELNVSDAWVSLRLTGKCGTIADFDAIVEKVGITPVWRDTEAAGDTEPHWYERSLFGSDHNRASPS